MEHGIVPSTTPTGAPAAPNPGGGRIASLLDDGTRLALFESLLDSSDQAVMSTAHDGAITSWNRAAEAMYGYSAREMLGRPIRLLMDPGRDDIAVITRAIEQGEAVRDYETTALRNDGTTVAVSVTVSPFYDADGTFVGTGVMARDITERRRWEERMIVAAAIIDSSDDAIISKSLDGVILSCNKAAERAYGYAADELVGRSVSLLIPPNRPDEMVEILDRIGRGERVEHFETERRCKDGSIIPISLTISPVRDATNVIVGASSIARDIRERVAAEARLRAAAHYARSLIEASLDPLVTIDAQGKITDVNEAAVKVAGMSRAELLGLNMAAFVTDPATAQAAFRQVFAQGMLRDVPLTIRHRDGHVTEVLCNASVYKDAAGVTVGALGTGRDMTALKQASQYARSLIEASLDPLVTISAAGKITDVNEATTRVTGQPRNVLIGTDFSEYFTEPEKAREGYEQVFALGQVTDYPLTIRHRDGHLTDVLYNASLYKDADGNVLGVFAAARDVTAQKQAEGLIAEQRARELDRLADLERFQKVTVGRELKMIELKKEIEELKTALATARRELP